MFEIHKLVNGAKAARNAPILHLIRALKMIFKKKGRFPPRRNTNGMQKVECRHDVDRKQRTEVGRQKSDDGSPKQKRESKSVQSSDPDSPELFWSKLEFFRPSGEKFYDGI
jgi:hypothetical protein